MNEQRRTVPSHANERLMNPLFESDEQLESSPRPPRLSARFDYWPRRRVPRLSGQVEYGPRPRVPWLVLLILASLLFSILGLAANFLAMARGS